MKNIIFFLLALAINSTVLAQDKTIDTTAISEVVNLDSVLRITNLNPFFTIHVDSILNYELNINKEIKIKDKTYNWIRRKGNLKLDKSTIVFEMDSIITLIENDEIMDTISLGRSIKHIKLNPR